MERQRLNTTLEKDFHNKLKIKAVNLNTDAGRILDYLIDKYLDTVKYEDLNDKQDKK